MNFYFKIKGKEEEFELDKEYIREITVLFDSPDESQARASKNDIRVEIRGTINDISCKITEQIFKWSMLNTGDVYRQLDIIAATQDNVVIRYYKLPEAFVVDYKEMFKEEDGTGDFLLVIKQKGDKLPNVSLKSKFNFLEDKKWL